MQKLNKCVGVWLDSRKALVIRINATDTAVTEINSEVEEFNPKGGYGSSTHYNMQDAVSEQTYLERKKHQIDDYFKRIMKELGDALHILILGPAETRIHLGKAIESNNQISGQIVENRAMDSLTENQIKAAVRDYFMTEMVF